MYLAMRRIAVRLWIAGAAAQPIAGCTPARYRDLHQTIESPTRLRRTLWEQTLVAIGCAAVVNRAAHFYLYSSNNGSHYH